MRSWSIPLARVLGVELRLHLTFFFLLVFVLAQVLEAKASLSASLLNAATLVFAMCASVFFHELGHLIVAARHGALPRSVILLPIGGVQFRDGSEELRRPSKAVEIAVALGGPIVNISLAFAAAMTVLLLHKDIDLLARPLLTSASLSKTLVWTNVFIAALNLVPAYPLDGGRILRALLVEDKDMDWEEATRRVVIMGQAFATFLIFAGIWNTWLMLVGFFLFVAVQIEDRSLVFQSVMQNVKLEEVMLTDFSTLSPADTLEDALDKAVHSLQDDFPVIRGSDLVGVISKQSIVEALRDDGNGYVQSAMKRAFDIGSRSESLATAFRKITSGGVSMIPVVEEDRLVGIVTLQNLMHSMGILAESRRLRRTRTGDE